MKPQQISVRNVGQIKHADVEFGDLTVLVGPQATGKSIFLQLLKLVIDFPAIHAELKRFNIDWENESASFMDIYFGEGMSGIWKEKKSSVCVDDDEVDLRALCKADGRRNKDEHVFFIPAQRVMSLRDGLSRPFTDYRSGDPFALREFSEKLHQLVQNEFGRSPHLFPQENRLKAALRDAVAQHIFGGFDLKTDVEKFQRRIVLSQPNSGKALPYLVWSAGQREFVPLLLGFYWLMPPSKVSTRDKLEWVVIEELEMGLHPNAISAVLSLVLELLARGYRVCLSTHSPHVLDVVWALQFLKVHGGTASDVLSLFSLKTDPGMRKLAEAALGKTYKVHYFGRDGHVKDISQLDPGSDDAVEAGWGGLTEFSGRIGEVVAKVANREEREAIA
jgi:hypothetical protein